MSDKVGSIEGLRLTALQAKGYTAQQVAALAEAIEELLLPLQEHVESAHAPANAEENVIVSIKKNGVAIAPVNKIVDIAVPTKTSDLTNDSGFITGSELTAAVDGAGHLKAAVVDELPAVADADANTVYYLRKNNSEAGKQYVQYKLINGVFETTGGEQDLSSYATIEYVGKADDALITSIFNTLSSSSEKYIGTANLAAFWSKVKPMITAHDTIINDLTSRVELLELIVKNDEVTGNPYYVTFEDLNGVTATGVWNTEDKRIEF